MSTNNTHYRQGIYEVINKDKYIGPKNPRYLSSYELETFRFLDRHADVIKWGAEVVVIKYWNPVKQRYARYIVDIYVKYKDFDGVIQEQLIEIKPNSQTSKPRKTNKKRQDVYEREMATFIQNDAKWEAAHHYCKERGMEFRLLTEKKGLFS